MNQQALIAGVEAMGLELLVKNPKDRLVTVTPVMIPAGIDDAKYRNQLLDEFNIEIAGGIGPLKGENLAAGLDGLLRSESECAAAAGCDGKSAG